MEQVVAISVTSIHTIILLFGLISLILKKYQLILIFITLWTLLLIIFTVIVHVISGKFWLMPHEVILLVLFIMATVTHAMLIKYPPNDEIARRMAGGFGLQLIA